MRPKKCPFHCIKTCDYTKSPYCIIMALYNAAKGNLSKGYAFCGANAYMSKKITSVRETIESLKSEFAAACPPQRPDGRALTFSGGELPQDPLTEQYSGMMRVVFGYCFCFLE